MVVIINHEREESEKINDLLNSNGVEARVSNNENLICSADHILITDCDNLNKLIRKFQLLNLFSVLKMINKPVIGLGLGAVIMHEEMTDVGLPGLGHLNGSARIIRYLGKPESVEVHKRANSKLENPNSLAVSKIIKVFPDDTAEMEFNLDGFKYPILIKSKNNFGIYVDIAASGINGLNFLKNIFEQV